MRKVTLRGLLAHKLRLALTALAIVLGVTFISGTFVLTDTLNNTFSSLFTSVYSKIDFQVRGVAQFGSGQSATRNPLPESLLPRVQGVPGVAGAFGNVTGYAQFIARDGKPIPSSMGTLGIGFDTNPLISNLHLIAGNPPTTSDDVVMDAATAKSYEFSVGQQVRILGGGLKSAESFTITGIAQFGTADNLAGTDPGGIHAANRAAGDRGDRAVRLHQRGGQAGCRQGRGATVDRQGPPVERRGRHRADDHRRGSERGKPGAVVLQHGAAHIRADLAVRRRVHHLQHVLDHRRPADARTCPAAGRRRSRRQVFRSVLTEAAIVGLVSSAIGVGLGVLAAIGLKALLNGFGTSLPAGPLTFEPRTAVVGLLVGTLVTVVSAIGPARNAVRIPPVAALTDRSPDGAGAHPTRRRLISGTAVTVLGVALLGIGLSKPVVALVGAGARLRLPRCRDARPGDRAAAVGPARAAARRAARRAGQARAGELHAQPEPHRPDRLGAHGRARPRVRDGGVRRVAV